MVWERLDMVHKNQTLLQTCDRMLTSVSCRAAFPSTAPTSTNLLSTLLHKGQTSCIVWNLVVQNYKIWMDMDVTELRLKTSV